MGGNFAYFPMYAHIKIAYKGGGGGQKWLKCCVRTIWMPPNMKIKERGFQANNVSLFIVSEYDVCTVIKNVDSSKAYQKDNIPPKVLKENSDVVSRFLKDDMNLNIGKFPENLKNHNYHQKT